MDEYNNQLTIPEEVSPPPPESAEGTVESKELSRLDILTVIDRKRQRVEVPEWEGHVFVRSLTGRERDAFEESLIITRGKSRDVNMRNLRAKLVSLCAVSSTGEQLFTAQDAQALGERNAAAMQRVFRVAQDLSGLREEDVEDLTKELGEDPSDDSGST